MGRGDFLPLGRQTLSPDLSLLHGGYYESRTPREGMFLAREQLEGRCFDLEFHWVPLEEVERLEVYPTQTPELLQKLDEGVQHFIYREE